MWGKESFCQIAVSDSHCQPSFASLQLVADQLTYPCRSMRPVYLGAETATKNRIVGVCNNSISRRVWTLAMTVQSHLLVNACWRNCSAWFSIWPTEWQHAYWRGTKVVIELYKLGSLKFICSELDLSDDVNVSVEVSQWSFSEIRHQLKNQTLHKSSMCLHLAEIQYLSFFFKVLLLWASTGTDRFDSHLHSVSYFFTA